MAAALSPTLPSQAHTPSEDASTTPDGSSIRRTLSIPSLCNPSVPSPPASSGSNSTTPTPTPSGLTPLKAPASVAPLASLPPPRLSQPPLPRNKRKDSEDEAKGDDDDAEALMAASALSGMRHAVYHRGGPGYRSQGGSTSSSATGSSSSLGDRGTVRGSGSASPEAGFKHPGAPASGKQWTGETLFPSQPFVQPGVPSQYHPGSSESVVSASLAPSLASLSTAASASASDTTAPSSSSSLSVSETTTPLSPATSVSSTDLALASNPGQPLLQNPHPGPSGVGRSETASGGIVFWDTVNDRPVAGPVEPDVGRGRSKTRDGAGAAEGEEGVEVEVVQMDGPEGGVFLQRVGKMPLVSGVVRAYERGKGTSRVVRYGADLVESSVTSIGGRVVSKVGPQRIAQIDRYAGAALDRLGYGAPSSAEDAPGDEVDVEMSEAAGEVEAAHPVRFYPSSASRDASESGGSGSSGGGGQLVETEGGEHGGQVAQVSRETRASPGRKRWQNMLVEAGMTAGGIGAAVSEESMKSLKYCLQWLQYANAHLDHQIALLRDFIASLHVATPSASSGTALVPHQSTQHLQTLTSIKRDVIETIRRVVDVVSKYAGGSLPEPAKAFVRKSILSLPVRWAAAIQQEGSTGSLTREGTPASSAMDTPLGTPNQRMQAGGYFGDVSGASSRPRGTSVSSMASSSVASSLPDGEAVATPGVPGHQRRATQQAAERILTFAVESLDMLRSVTAIFSESVDRADAWVERLRVLGVQHRQQRSQQPRGAVTAGPEGEGAEEVGDMTIDQPSSATQTPYGSHAMTPSESGDSLSSSQVLSRSSMPPPSSTTQPAIGSKRRKANGGASKPVPVPSPEGNGGERGTSGGGGLASSAAAALMLGVGGGVGGGSPIMTSPRGGEWEDDEEAGAGGVEEEELRRKKVQRSRLA